MSKNITRLCTSWPLFMVSIMWLFWFVNTDVFARLQGRMFPVVTPITVTSVEPTLYNGQEASKISGFATIKRESCDYMSVSFRLRGSDRDVHVNAFFADRAQIRKPGQQQWEALMVGVPPEKLSVTAGDVKHECGGFPVISPFFVPDESVVPTEIGATALCASGAYTSSTGPGTCSGHGGVKEWINA